MLLKSWMTRTIITVDADQSMHEATRLMRENSIKILPVTIKDELVGIITDRDLKRASPSDATTLDVHELLYLVSRIKVRDLMTEKPYTISENHTVEEAAALMLEKRISGLPVMDAKGGLSGIITQSDLFRVLISLTGMGKVGIQFCVRVEDRIGAIAEIKDIVKRFEARTANILTSDEDVPEGMMNVHFRVYRIDREQLPKMIEQLQEKTDLRYMVDHRENKRTIYSA